MIIPTEPIGSIPRPLSLIELVRSTDSQDPKLNAIYDEAIRDTIARFEETGSPVVSDGEQRKYHNFLTYCVDGSSNISPDGCLGTTDDCGFSPFSDDTSTTHDTAFAKIRARVLGTALAAQSIAGG